MLARPRDGAGTVWGEDFVLKRLEFADTSCTCALTYIEVLSLSAADLYRILRYFPAEMARVRFACAFYTVRSQLVKFGTDEKKRRLGTLVEERDGKDPLGKIAETSRRSQRRRGPTLVDGAEGASGTTNSDISKQGASGTTNSDISKLAERMEMMDRKLTRVLQRLADDEDDEDDDDASESYVSESYVDDSDGDEPAAPSSKNRGSTASPLSDVRRSRTRSRTSTIKVHRQSTYGSPAAGHSTLVRFDRHRAPSILRRGEHSSLARHRQY